MCDYTGIVKILCDWQTLVAGIGAVLAAGVTIIVTMCTARRQVAAADRQTAAVKEQNADLIRRRKLAYTAMALLETRRIQGEAKKQQYIINTTNPDVENLEEAKYILSRIEMRDVLGSEWEQPGLLDPDTASSIYALVNAVDEFNTFIAPRGKPFEGSALSLLKQIISQAEYASKRLNWTLALLGRSSGVGHQLCQTLLQGPGIFGGSCACAPSWIIVPP